MSKTINGTEKFELAKQFKHQWTASMVTGKPDVQALGNLFRMVEHGSVAGNQLKAELNLTSDQIDAAISWQANDEVPAILAQSEVARKIDEGVPLAEIKTSISTALAVRKLSPSERKIKRLADRAWEYEQSCNKALLRAGNCERKYNIFQRRSTQTVLDEGRFLLLARKELKECNCLRKLANLAAIKWEDKCKEFVISRTTAWRAEKCAAVESRMADYQVTARMPNDSLMRLYEVAGCAKAPQIDAPKPKLERPIKKPRVEKKRGAFDWTLARKIRAEHLANRPIEDVLRDAAENERTESISSVLTNEQDAYHFLNKILRILPTMLQNDGFPLIIVLPQAPSGLPLEKWETLSSLYMAREKYRQPGTIDKDRAWQMYQIIALSAFQSETAREYKDIFPEVEAVGSVG